MDQSLRSRSRPTVVIVEDDASLLGALAFDLQVDGYQVLGYTDGRDLLSAPLHPGTDCLVVDLRLPGIDGLALIEALRARGETAPAILITTNPEAWRRGEAAMAGVEIVEKPLLGGELSLRIEAAISRRPA